MKRVIFTCGRCNPITTGHAKLFAAAQRLGEGDVRVFLTKTHDSVRNPLAPEEKLSFARRLFPALDIRLATNAWDAARQLAADGYTHATFLVGEDRLGQFADLPRYANHSDPKKTLGLHEVVLRHITRPPGDASATMARAMVQAENIEGFAAMVPSRDRQLTEDLYRAVKRGMGV